MDMAKIARSRSTGFVAFPLVALSLPLLATSGAAQEALPQNPTVISGGVDIGLPAGSSLTITQTTPRAIVNWQSFSIGQGNTVTFHQPDTSSAILNRVTGNTTSSIAGQLNANGQVFLVNPNGIVITPTGTVKTGGGFVASTLDIANEDFLSGQLAFSGNGASARASNAGTISTDPGGFVALLGGSVANSGTISVPLGRVGLGSGERVTLDLYGDGFLQVAVPTGSEAEGALIEQSGKISASGGRVELKAATVREAIREAVNMSGVVAARSVFGRDGAIVLGGGPGGKVRVTGRMTTVAESSASKGTGGDFINHGGTFITAGTARWLIYASDPSTSLFGGLDSGNHAIWNATYASLAPDSVTQTGNRYLFAYRPTVTFTSTDASKTYGDVIDLSSHYTVSGVHPGVAGAFLADTAANAYTGAPELSSEGQAANASVAGGPYEIVISQGSLTALSGYELAFDSVGQLTITKAALTITANDLSKIYGDTLTFAGTEFTASGLVSGDQVTSVTLMSLGAAANAEVGTYDIVPSDAVGNGLSNYTITYVNGILTVAPAQILVPPANQLVPVSLLSTLSLEFNSSDISFGSDDSFDLSQLGQSDSVLDSDETDVDVDE